MAQVIRFFHIRDLKQPRGGATVRVVGEDDGLAVRVQVAYCSPNDQFCRLTGRTQAEKSSTLAIPLKGLPAMLRKVAKKVLRRYPYNGMHHGVDIPRTWRQRHELMTRDFSFSMKYWIPKVTLRVDGDTIDTIH